MLPSKEGRDRRIVWDLKDLTLVDREVVSFLRRSEADGIQLKMPGTHPGVARWKTARMAQGKGSTCFESLPWPLP
jgi:hypothetical protein